jgi:hypothetical protein
MTAIKPQTGLTFTEALPLLLSGHIIRRKVWEPNDCLYMQRGVMKMLAYGSVTRMRLLSVEGVLADDWEEIEAVKV